jgi:hypothetical protein
MDEGHDLATSRRFLSLAGKFRDEQYRNSYVASHNRGVLAQQMRNFRGDLSQADYAEKIGKQKTVVGRLENPAYEGWSFRTMLEVARKEGVAVIVRFVDFPTFLKYSGDLSDAALNPRPYDQGDVDELVKENENVTSEGALKALLSAPSVQPDPGPSARNALLSQVNLGDSILTPRRAPAANANDLMEWTEQRQRYGALASAGERVT